MDSRLALAYGGLVSEIAVVFGLWLRGLHLRYPMFALYLSADCVRSLALASVAQAGLGGAAYTEIWISTEPLLLILQLFVAGEIYRHFCSHYPAFTRVGRQLALVAAGIAFGLVVGTAHIELVNTNWANPWLQSLQIAKRFVMFGCAVFGVGTALFFRHFRVPVRPNVSRHAITWLMFACINAAGYFALNLHADRYVVGVALMLGNWFCYVAWFFAFTVAGEDATPIAAVTEAEIDATQRQTEELRRLMCEVRGIDPREDF